VFTLIMNPIPVLSLEAQVKRAVRDDLRSLGFEIKEGKLICHSKSKDAIRELYKAKRIEKTEANRKFISNKSRLIESHFASGSEIDPIRITPYIEVVNQSTLESDIFRLASLT